MTVKDSFQFRNIIQTQQKILSLFFTVISVFIFTQCTKSQSQEKPVANAGAVPAGSNPSIKGEAAGEVKPFNFKSGDLKTELSNLPAPKVWLVFATGKNQAKSNSTDEAETTKIELPTEAAEVIASLWQNALMSRYNAEVAGLPSVDDYVKEDIKLGRATHKAKNKLMKIEIMSPEGKRTISFDEAGEIVKFINASAADIIEPFKRPKS